MFAALGRGRSVFLGHLRVCTLVLLAGWLALGVAALQVGPRAMAADDPAGAAKELPEPEDVTLNGSRGVNIVATYYPGMHGKDTLPVLLLHMHKGSRKDYHELAVALQEVGHAVMVPDLRGHGDSPLYDQKNVRIEVDKLRREHFQASMEDVELCKRFLMDKNNSGELNIDKLCVVGAEFGAILAVNWTAVDWSAIPLPAMKQGQDVKAVLLLSPKYTMEGVTINDGLKSPALQKEILIGIISGKNDADARRLDKAFGGFRPGGSGGKRREQTVFYTQLNTTLEGTKMITAADLNVIPKIRRFIDLVAQKNIPWQDRKLLD
ncbi:MAG: alpha/beta hydrolase [Pirellulales bacterium]